MSLLDKFLEAKQEGHSALYESYDGGIDFVTLMEECNEFDYEIFNLECAADIKMKGMLTEGYSVDSSEFKLLHEGIIKTVIEKVKAGAKKLWAKLVNFCHNVVLYFSTIFGKFDGLFKKYQNTIGNKVSDDYRVKFRLVKVDIVKSINNIGISSFINGCKESLTKLNKGDKVGGFNIADMVANIEGKIVGKYGASSFSSLKYSNVCEKEGEYNWDDSKKYLSAIHSMMKASLNKSKSSEVEAAFKELEKAAYSAKFDVSAYGESSDLDSFDFEFLTEADDETAAKNQKLQQKQAAYFKDLTKMVVKLYGSYIQMLKRLKSSCISEARSVLVKFIRKAGKK